MIWGEHDTLVCIRDRLDIMKRLCAEGIESVTIDAGHSMNDEPFALSEILG